MRQQGLLTKYRLMKRIGRLLLAGVLTSAVGATYPLEQVREAVRTAAQPARQGKVLLPSVPQFEWQDGSGTVGQATGLPGKRQASGLPHGSYDRTARRNLAERERGLASFSSSDARTGSGECSGRFLPAGRHGRPPSPDGPRRCGS